jgi:hypothetical protein
MKQKCNENLLKKRTNRLSNQSLGAFFSNSKD